MPTADLRPQPSDTRPAPGNAGPERRRRRTRWLLAAGVVVLAAAAYGWFIPVHTADEAALAQLVPTQPPAGFKTKPSTHSAVPPSEAGLPALAKAAKATPDGTGAFAVDWSGKTKGTTAVAYVLVAVVPSTSDATAVRKAATTRYLGTKSMKAAGYALGQRFTVSAAGDAHGATLTPTSTSTSTTGATGAAVVMGTGHVVAVVFVETTGTATRRDAVELAEAEQASIERVGTDFSPATTSFPTIASIVFAAGTAGVLVVVLGGPPAVDRVRRRRAAARLRATERQRLARGRKVVKRHHSAYGSVRSGGRRRSRR